MRLNRFIFTCVSILFFILMHTSCIDGEMYGAPYYVFNEGYSVYVLNYSDSNVAVTVDEKEIVVTPTEKSFSDLADYARAWKEDNYEDEFVNSGVFFFSEEADGSDCFPVDISCIKPMFSEDDRCKNITIAQNGKTIFSSLVSNDLSNRELYPRGQFWGIQISQYAMNHGHLVFSPEIDEILMLVYWKLDIKKNSEAGTATSPRYVLVIPPEDEVHE